MEMATMDETSSSFPVYSSEGVDIASREDSYEDDCADEYASEFDEVERTSPSLRAASPAPAAPAAVLSDAGPAPEAQRAQTAAEPTTVSTAAETHAISSHLPPSRLPVWIGATKQTATAAAASASAPVSRLSSKPARDTATDSPHGALAVSQHIAARLRTLTITSPPATAASPQPGPVSSSAPTSKPPSRSTAKPTSSTSAKWSSFPSSPSAHASLMSSKPSVRSTAFVKVSKSTLSSLQSSPSRKSSKPSFDFTHDKSYNSSTTAAHTRATQEGPTTALSHDTAPHSPRLATLQREAGWDGTPFVPPVVPQFTTYTNTTTQPPLLDVKQSAWQLQQPRTLPPPPNVLLRKPKSEVATHMSAVVMRTRQLRRRTKDRGAAVAAPLRGKEGKAGGCADEVGGVDGGGSEVESVRLAVGERVEQRSERRPRHNSPLARSRVTGTSSY